jgi:hypothetical protein
MDKMSKWIGGGFIIGAVFWAGGTYNRISGIEQQLIRIEAAIPSAARIAGIETRMEYMQREVDALKARR